MRLFLLSILLPPLGAMAQSNDSVWVTFFVSDFLRESYAISDVQITVDQSMTKTIGVDGSITILLSKGNHTIDITAMSYYPRNTTVNFKDSGDYHFYMVSNGQPLDDILWEELAPTTNTSKIRKGSRKKRLNRNK